MIENESNYSASRYRTPDGAPADIVVFTIVSAGKPTKKKALPTRELQVMLIRRKIWPYEGQWALPGGFTRESESVHDCAIRELKEETAVENVNVDYFNVYSAPGRDPRGWMISHAFLALVNERLLEKRAADVDASDVRLFPVEEALKLELAFDHRQILADALLGIRHKMLTTKVAKEFLPEAFTLSELYQIIQTVVPDYKEPNFIRKLTSTKSRSAIIEEVRDEKGVPKLSNQYSQRAAQLYRFTNEEPQLSIYN
ncbi:NUDIX domain-containing protein [Paenibacillus harenae]|uniref:NUDIX domain-containing protein n=1 Tax=Paenibacillus harenae TaxID=306543 RepID=UPI0004198BDB|nr:NUDIX domain-containing protein [Paenibacillus harenae]